MRFLPVDKLLYPQRIVVNKKTVQVILNVVPNSSVTKTSGSDKNNSTTNEANKKV